MKGKHLKKYISFYVIYFLLFILGLKTLSHGFPDIERFFAEWMDERLTLTYIMKFGTLNFAPTQIFHPPLYHYLTFIPIAVFFIIGKIAGLFHDKIDFVRFYFNNTHYFFFIGRMMSYIFFWLSAVVIFKIVRLFYNKTVSHLTVISYLVIPRFIFDFSTTRPETLLFLNASLFFYFFLKYYLDNTKVKYLFISAFLLGVSIATKYNAAYLGVIFIGLLIFQIKDGAISHKKLLTLYFKAGFLVFLGFFMCDPFFVLQFNKYFYNLEMYYTEIKSYWKGDYSQNHFQELLSFVYINIFGAVMLAFGAWSFLKRYRRLGIIFFITIVLYEIYFGIFLKNNYSPLRYLNPVIPIVGLIFGAGVDFIFNYRRKLILIFVMFISILAYNYFDVWKGLSFGPTHIQRARAFIEKTIPEFTTICIASKLVCIPQLNMTKESYYSLIKTVPVTMHTEGHELPYKKMEDEDNYDSVFRDLRIQSMMKKPQYNIIVWDKDIKTLKDAVDFIKDNNIKYIITSGALMVNNENLENNKIISFIREFKPNNVRIYRIAYTDINLVLYKVNL